MRFFQGWNLSTLVLSLGCLIRIFHWWVFGGTVFYQMDRDGHLEYIHYFAEHLSLPSPWAGWSFPHQPLYYVFFGLFERAFGFGFKPKELISLLSLASLILSIVNLIIIQSILKKIVPPKWEALILGVFAFTPSFIFLSTRINNDVLVLFVSACALFFLTRQQHFQTGVASILAFLSKANGLSTLCAAGFSLFSQKSFRQTRLFLGLTGVAIISIFFYLTRSYNPETKSIYITNTNVSSGLKIKDGINSSFQFLELLRLAQSYSWEKRSTLIKYSPVTFAYGTLLLGEYNYEKVYSKMPFSKSLARTLIVFGLVIPFFTLIGAYRSLRSPSKIGTFAFLQVFLNVALLVLFFLDLPFLCNADFRYLLPAVPAVLVLLGFGVEKLNVNKSFWIQNAFVVYLCAGFLFETVILVLGQNYAIFNG